MAGERVPENASIRVPQNFDDLRRVFGNHYEYYTAIKGEVAHQQETGEGEIQREYYGRVVFELLQNAIDRAEENVYVGVVESFQDGYEYALTVANDGLPVRVDPWYDYENPPEVSGASQMRSDFNALCSLHTSNKSRDETIGTKGIGFSSVFHLDSYVRVWSQADNDSAWWGMEMHSPFNGEVWARRQADADIRRGVDRFLSVDEAASLEDETSRPSYHFPLPLLSGNSSCPVIDAAWPNTVVVVPIPEEMLEVVSDQIDQLKRHHLYFTGLSSNTHELDVIIEGTDGNRFQRRTWPSDDADCRVASWRSDGELSQLAANAELDIGSPSAAVAWPPESTSSESTKRESKIYGYLPTLMEGPFGVDVHGDFQLTIDRTNLRLDDNTIGRYNRGLLRACAEIHVLEALTRAGVSPEAVSWDVIDPEEVNYSTPVDEADPGVHFWQFLDPTAGGSQGAADVIDYVEMLLFETDKNQEPECFAAWASLATAVFDARKEWPIQTYREFWEASLGWIDRACDTKTRGKNWRRVALAMCDALREESAAVAPIILDADDESDGEVDAVPLPPRRDVVGKGGHLERSDRELFLRATDQRHPALPTVLRENDRVVTTFDFYADLHQKSPNALGARQFNRWQFFSEVRQLPATLIEWAHEPIADGDPVRAAAWQQELIEFVAELYLLDTGSGQPSPAESGGFSVGWRVRDDISENQRRAGRALATLFLPTGGDQWQPARELHVGEVDVDRLGDLPEDLPVEQFLIFLGVAETPPDDGVALRLIEGGEDRRIGPVDIPPVPTPAGRGRSDVTFHAIPGADTADPHEWREALREAWDDWLGDLLTLERRARSESDADDDIPVRTALREPLRMGDWYPVGENGADPPVDVDVTDGGVAPRRVALISPQQHQFPRVIWSVDQTRHDIDTALLREAGAVPGLDPEQLRADDADTAFTLLTQLQRLDLERVQEDPRDHQALDRLFNRVLNAIVRGDESERIDELRLLIMTNSSGETTLKWISPSVDVWIPETPQDRKTVRSYFPSERCVVATVPGRPLRNYPPLSNHGIDIDRVVRSAPPDGKETERAADMQSCIQEIIPELLALVEATTRIDIDIGDVMDRWSPDIIREGDDVWEEITASFGENPPRTVERLRDNGGEVLVQTGDSPRIFYDRDTEGELPPVADFGEALALVLLGDQGKEVESLFARALTARFNEQTRLQRLVDRKGATGYVERFRAEFAPLDEEERARLLEETTEVLATLDIRLDVTRPSAIRDLSPEDLDLTDASEGVAESSVQDALTDIELPATREWDWFRPRFACEDTHERQWTDWFDRYEEQLIPYLEEFLLDNGVADATPQTIRADLDTFVRDERCPRVAFDPASSVVAWLRQFEHLDDVPLSDDLLEQARRHETKFEPVGDIMAGDSSFRPRSITEPTPRETETGTITRADVTRKTQAQMRVGEDAEEAIVEQIVKETIESINTAVEAGAVASVEDGLRRLTWALPDDGVTVNRLKNACTTFLAEDDPAVLADGLHISQAWDGAGFDLLGLRFKEGELVPVRSEVKALSDDLPASVHLSTNQLAVYERVEHQESKSLRYHGCWRLLGVTPSGEAHDLTVFLRELPRSALQDLWESGFDHDGLVLTIESIDPVE